MHLTFQRFQREHFPEYRAWFADPELNRHLGPMDEAWLEAVLAQPEAEGETWAVFHSMELVAVVETVFDPAHRLPAAITAVTTKPSRCRQGIGAAVLKHILSLHQGQGFVEHVAYISLDNIAGRACAEKVGFVPVTSQPDGRGFIKYRHRF